MARRLTTPALVAFLLALASMLVSLNPANAGTAIFPTPRGWGLYEDGAQPVLWVAATRTWLLQPNVVWSADNSEDGTMACAVLANFPDTVQCTVLATGYVHVLPPLALPVADLAVSDYSFSLVGNPTVGSLVVLREDGAVFEWHAGYGWLQAFFPMPGRITGAIGSYGDTWCIFETGGTAPSYNNHLACRRYGFPIGVPSFEHSFLTSDPSNAPVLVVSENYACLQYNYNHPVLPETTYSWHRVTGHQTQAMNYGDFETAVVHGDLLALVQEIKFGGRISTWTPAVFDLTSAGQNWSGNAFLEPITLGVQPGVIPTWWAAALDQQWDIPLPGAPNWQGPVPVR